ncbi:GFA family protein [Sphingobium ummariense]
MKHEESCHCGTIRVAIEDDPVDAGECNCSICRRTGALWTYRSPSQVKVAGMGVGYVQGDATLTLWHCATCGVTTHWSPHDPTYDRMGINLRLFDPALWNGLPRRFIDGASW